MKLFTRFTDRELSPIMCQLHERSPVILEPDARSLWFGDTAITIDLMLAAGDDGLHLWPVSRAVNLVRNNCAELLDRIEDPHAAFERGAGGG